MFRTWISALNGSKQTSLENSSKAEILIRSKNENEKLKNFNLKQITVALNSDLTMIIEILKMFKNRSNVKSSWGWGSNQDQSRLTYWFPDLNLEVFKLLLI